MSLVPFSLLQGEGRKSRRVLLLFCKVVGSGQNQRVYEKWRKNGRISHFVHVDHSVCMLHRIYSLLNCTLKMNIGVLKNKVLVSILLVFTLN